MSLGDFAKAIGVSYETVRREVDGGRLRARMMRGSERGMFVTEEEVERWAREETVEARPA
ncbi:helix-turn-helix domain-containing protein [Gordonibacter urolithinfaciens]|uniref:helix-turn-helix domain-containing protein n=1 Tax=Gordonibacter urolithinfaciens TaxID=1335613 RepID=UPI003A93EB96